VVARDSTSPFEVQEVQLKIRYVLVTAGIVSALTAAPAFSQADNTNSRWSPSALDTWMDRDYSTTYSDRVARDAYIEQAERRRAAIERHERLSGVPLDQGYVIVTPDQGYVVVSPDPNYGVSPNPSRVGRSNSSTNPTGNELQGENGGGK
jgi:hypothetical protein